jgi:hypothetical protein
MAVNAVAATTSADDVATFAVAGPLPTPEPEFMGTPLLHVTIGLTWVRVYNTGAAAPAAADAGAPAPAFTYQVLPGYVFQLDPIPWDKLSSSGNTFGYHAPAAPQVTDYDYTKWISEHVTWGAAASP